MAGIKCRGFCYVIFILTSICRFSVSGLYEGDWCTISQGKLGTCTLLEQCKSVYEALVAGRIKPGSYTRCSFKKKDEVICCEDIEPIPDLANRTHIPQYTDEFIFPYYHLPTDSIPFETPVVGKRKSELACERYFEGYTIPLSFHIINGLPAAVGEFPHMVAIAHSTIGEGKLNFDCGASLISENFALTAAHCVDRPERRPTLLRLGKISLQDRIDNAVPVDVGVTEIIMHPSYRSNRVYHDIALMRLNRTLDFNENVMPICLYTDKSPINQMIPLTATGWGKINFTTSERSDVLLKVNLTAVAIEDCNATYAESGFDRRVQNGVIEGQICAHDLVGDACQGDSGGPLQIVSEDKRSTLVGVISVGVGCGSSIPGLYTSVAHYLDWIESIVW